MEVKKSIIFIGMGILSCQLLLSQDFSFKPKYSATLDSDKGVKILSQCSRAVPAGALKFWNPEKSHIKNLENK